MKKLALYLRVSTQDKQNTEIQFLELKKMAEQRCWDIVGVYEDKISGRTDGRPQFKQMMTDAKEGKFEVLACWKLDRLFRSLRGLTTTLAELQKYGIQFVSLKDNIDLTTSQGRLMMHLLGSFAEFEADLIRERVIAGVRNAQRKGVRLGRPPKANHSEIYSLRSQGLSLMKISKIVGITKAAVYKSLQKLQMRTQQ